VDRSDAEMRCIPIKVGVVGTGFVSGLFVRAAARSPDLRVTRILTRRPRGHDNGVPAPQLLTRDRNDLEEQCDVVLECSGDVWHAAEVIESALTRNLPVATLNSQFHVTLGSHFVGRGLVSECEGDQPGSLAALKAEAIGMGFTPLAYVSMKGFLDPDPTPDSMQYWAEKQGISMPMVTSFTDGTKLDIEQVLVANGCGATIPLGGMIGPKLDSVNDAAAALAQVAYREGEAVSDYVLSRVLPHGVFIAASHDPEQSAALRYLKCGDGPVYGIVRPAIYAHLEAMRSIRALVRERRVLLDNTARPRFSVGAVAKRDLRVGDHLPYGIGSFDVRSRVLRMAENPNHMPIGLIKNAIVRRTLKRGALIMFEDLELPDGLARRAWQCIRDAAISDGSRNSHNIPAK
jgi:predicted homoserine dehydrogenase-like protein